MAYYRSVLRVSLLVTAFLLVFDSGALSPLTQEFSWETQLYLAQSIGVYAGVAPTELNALSAELQKRDAELDAREAAIRTIEARAYPDNRTSYSTYILAVILFILSVLIILNYILDWRRVQLRAV
jgi:hypothetical protein